RAAVERLEIEHPVCIDQEFLMWRRFENQGWPARYLFDRRLRLFEYHYGEGAYAETEAAIQELLGADRPLIEPLHPEDRPDAQIVVPTAEQPGAYSGPYEAGGVWVIAEGDGDLIVNGSPQAITFPGALQIVDHGVNTNSVLELDVPAGITVHATVFTPGVAARV
ncbi:MAG TPA: DipZ protein, partial [Baekduia sp.]|nr:DipZ protein [Baekduia sp.]